MIDSNRKFRGAITAPAVLSREGQELVEFGLSKGWQVKYHGRRAVVSKPTFLRDWWLVPAVEDRTSVPKRALNRVTAIYGAGLRPQSFVIAHEAPRFLPAPKNFTQGALEQRLGLKVGFPASLVAAVIAAGVLLTVGISLILLVLLLAAIFVVVGGLVALVAVDPVLFVVTEHGEWIEIDRWSVSATG